MIPENCILQLKKSVFSLYAFFILRKVKMWLKHKQAHAAYGEDPVIDWICQKWIAKSYAGE